MEEICFYTQNKNYEKIIYNCYINYFKNGKGIAVKLLNNSFIKIGIYFVEEKINLKYLINILNNCLKNYKINYFKNNLKLKINKKIIKEIINFNLKIEQKFLFKKVDLTKPIFIDNLFMFKLKSLQDNWLETIDFLQQNINYISNYNKEKIIIELIKKLNLRN